MSRYIFLSYSRDEVSISSRLQEKLKDAGFNVWMDKSELEIGDNWRQKIVEAIRLSQAIVIALSPSAKSSPYVTEEIDLALKASVPLFPIIIHGRSDTAVPDSLKHLQYDDEEEEFNSRVKNLTQALYDYAAIRRLDIPWRIIAAALAGLLILVAAIAFILLRFGQPVVSSVSLISVRYVADGFDPRLVDMRTAEADGIPIRANVAFQIDNLWVSVSGETAGYTLGAELYAGDEYIGASNITTLRPGMMSLGAIIPKNYIHSTVNNAVSFQASWDHLVIALVIYKDGVAISTARTTIRIDPTGTSWVWDAPHAYLASVVYSINGGPELVFDPRARLDGIDAHPGDQITLHQVWYRSDTSSADASVQVEAYITAIGYDPTTVQVSSSSEIRFDINQVDNFAAMTWQVRPADAFWVIYLNRDDGPVLDSYIIPLNANKSPGLLSSSNVLRWPFSRATYVDFENQPDLADWFAGDTSSIAQSSAEAFSGSYSLAVTTTSAAEDNQKVFWDRPLQADTIVGQVYWPEQAGVYREWAQFCAWACVPIDVQANRWNTFSMDVSELTYNDTPLTDLRIPQLWIQVQLNGVGADNPYTFYVDGIQYFPND